ncbi:hypothetical protein AGMMS49579_08500 [Spirochaetia bacterium]|nr:hypothetical protein AGMMS49579_08500 [Spirochaetia bacterium]
MLAVKGIYDGAVARPKETVPFTEDYNVVITFLEPSVSTARQNVNRDVKTPENTSLEERMNAAHSLIGIIKGSTMTLEEARAERLARQ